MKKSNTGVILIPPTPTDFVFGANKLPFETILPKGDWEDLLPSDERQSNFKADYMNCVSQSADSLMESQINLLFFTYPLGLQNWLRANNYFDENGKINFNDCYTAKMGKTGKNGAGLAQIWDSIRHNGLIPEKDWHRTQDNLSWNEYYSEIPANLIAKGKRFKDFFDISYEWVYGGGEGRPVSQIPFGYHLKQAPIQIASACCSPWGAGIIPMCYDPACHATIIYGLQSYAKDFDTYEPFRKKLASNYLIYQAMKGVLKVKTHEITTEKARYIWCKRADDLQAVYPKEKGLVAYDGTNIYDWCANYGVYEAPEVFIDNQMEWGKVEEKIKPMEMPPLQVKKNFINEIWNIMNKFYKHFR